MWVPALLGGTKIRMNMDDNCTDPVHGTFYVAILFLIPRKGSWKDYMPLSELTLR